MIWEKEKVMVRMVSFLSVWDLESLALASKSMESRVFNPRVYEMLAKAPSRPLLLNCFRRASDAMLREVDAPPPNVNRHGSCTRVKAMLTDDTVTIPKYCFTLRSLYVLDKKLQAEPVVLRGKKPGALKYEAIDCVRTLKLCNRMPGPNNSLLSGSISSNGTATFRLWSVSASEKTSTLHATITNSHSKCYDVCDGGLAISSSDGSVRVWKFLPYTRGWNPLADNQTLKASTVLSSRSSILPPFLQSKFVSSIIKVAMDDTEDIIRVATASSNGTANVWDANHGKMLISVPYEKIHSSRLTSSTPFSKSSSNTPQVSSLMLFHNKLVCGTTEGLIRVFDIRSGKLAYRVRGHPSRVSSSRTNGGVMWSGGEDGTVRWWGGRRPKIVPKSSLCAGAVSALEIDESVVVAGYSEQGVNAWDIRSHNALATFSNSYHGGVKTLQFDKSKLVTVSNTGKAALWRWHKSSPHHWFPELPANNSYSSVHYDSSNLLLGTTSGEVYHYSLEASKSMH